MFDPGHLMSAILVISLLAVVIVLMVGSRLSERHHSHHDTYSASPVVPRTLALVMIFMGILGGLIGWLCHLDVFLADPIVPMSFFVAFQVTVLLMLGAVMRYQVMAYDDYMIVRPTLGRTRTINYDQIERMEWVPSMLGPNLLDLRVCPSEGRPARIWCLIDIEQVLLRIDRYEVMED